MKDWWKSKMLWLNIISIAAIIIQSETGYIVSPEAQLLILGTVNMLLRTVTKEKLQWKKCQQ